VINPFIAVTVISPANVTIGNHLVNFPCFKTWEVFLLANKRWFDIDTKGTKPAKPALIISSTSSPVSTRQPHPILRDLKEFGGFDL
jgi:hypothetical protein